MPLKSTTGPELLLGLVAEQSDDEELVFAADDGSKPVSSQGASLAALEGLLLHINIAMARDSFCQQHYSYLEESSPEAQQQQLFQQYRAIMEGVFLEQQLEAQGTDGPVVTLQQLAEKMQEQPDTCNDEVCDLLLSVSDLGAFVALLADFRQADAERAAGGGGPLELQGSKAGLHAEEQEDGEERPDLDLSLSVTALGQRLSHS